MPEPARVTFTLTPLGQWGDAETPPQRRTRGPFTAGWQNTLDLLCYEVSRLGGRQVTVGIDVTSGDFRRDGMLRQDARVGFPGVRVTFDSRHGTLVYGTDVYKDWRDNVRGIALGLEALRAVDRYGVSRHGQQYSGFKALPAGTGGPANTNMTRESAASLLALHSGIDGIGAADLLDSPAQVRRAYLAAASLTHPDAVGGHAETFVAIETAYRLLSTTLVGVPEG